MSRYPNYPGGEPAWLPHSPQSRGPVPGSVMLAVRLMYVGAVVSAAGMVVGLATTGNLRATIRKADPSLTASQVTTAAHLFTVSIVIGGVLGIGLWTWLAIANQRGRNWARITGTVFFGLDTISLIASFSQQGDMVARALPILVWLIGLTVVVLLWRPASSAYFKAPLYPQ